MTFAGGLGGLLLSALAALVWLVVSPQTRPRDGVIVFLALALIGVASSLRQRLELRENSLLNRELQAVNASLEARVKSAVGTLERRNLELEVQTQESSQRTREVTLLNELGELLQMCVSFEEASAVISRMGPHFFPTPPARSTLRAPRATSSNVPRAGERAATPRCLRPKTAGR